MGILLTIAFLFFFGSLVGWVIELIFRKFFSGANPEHKWINPGFLVGPYLPLYGFSLCILFLLSYMDFSFIENTALRLTVLFLSMTAVITLFEYIAGLIFIKGMKVKLWDYSDQWGNVQGIICPLFSFFWLILSVIYYFFIHPYINKACGWLSNNLAFSFVIGFFYGVFLIDFCYSINIMAKIRKFAAEKQIVVRFEHLKGSVRQHNAELKAKGNFFFFLHGKSHTLAENLKQYAEREKEKLLEKIEKKD